MHPEKHPVLIVLSLIVVLIIGVVFIAMQDSNPADERGTLTGNVVDASDGHPLKGVTVTAIDKDGVRYTNHENTDTTSEDGFFSLELPPQDYTLLFEADDYQTFESSASYKVKKDQELEVEEAFRLAASDGSEPGQSVPGYPAGQIPSSSGGNSSGTASGNDGGQTPVTPPAQVPVAYTICCMDVDGKQLSTMNSQGTVGSTVTVYAPDLTGYTAESTEQKITLSADAGANVVTFYYDKPSSAQADPYIIPPNAFVYNGHSYYACMANVDNISSFWEAESYCQSQGGHLAVIDSADLNDALYDYVFDTLGLESAYFGLTDDGSEGDWYWVNGADYNYQNWLSGQPDNHNGNEDYALFYYKDKRYKWNDGDFGPDENGNVTFLIEWDTE